MKHRRTSLHQQRGADIPATLFKMARVEQSCYERESRVKGAHMHHLREMDRQQHFLIETRSHSAEKGGRVGVLRVPGCFRFWSSQIYDERGRWTEKV